MTTTFHVVTDRSDRLTIDGRHYTVDSWRGSAVKLRRADDDRGLVETFDSETLRAIWDRVDFRHERYFYSDTAAGGVGMVPKPTVSTLNKRDKLITLGRVEYVHQFLRLLALPNNGYKRTYDSAREAAAVIRPHVDGLGYFALDDDHRIGIEQETKRKRRVGQAMLVDGKPQIMQHEPPCGETLMRWLWAFQRSGGDPMSLKPDYINSGHFGSHLAPEVEALIIKHLHGYYLTRIRPTMTMFLDKVVRAVKDLNKTRRMDKEPLLVLPGMGSVERAVAGLGAHYVDTHRYGPDYADKAHPWNGDGLDIQVPGQRVEMDAYQCDLITLMTWSGFWEGLTRKQRRALKKKRMWLTVAIDRATRVILGMKLSNTPNVPNAIATLEMIESDKTGYSTGAGTTSSWHHRTGTMTVVADGAYVSHELRAAMADARGTIEYPQAGDPKMRAVVERLFRSVAMQLMARLDGKTFSNIFERADYDSEGNAGFTVDELAWLLVTWVVDIYHNTPHQGLNGRTPNQGWDEAVDKFGIHPWRDAHARRSSFGTRLKRKLSADGFEVLGNRYQDDDPNGLRHLYLGAIDPATDREFEILFDQSNMGAISVVVGDVAVMVPNRDPAMDGVRALDVIEAAASLREENSARNEIPIGIAHEAIRRIEERNAMVGYRSSIAQQILDSGQIDALEAEHFDGLRFAFDPETTESSVLGRSIAAFAGDIFLADGEPQQAADEDEDGGEEGETEGEATDGETSAETGAPIPGQKPDTWTMED